MTGANPEPFLLVEAEQRRIPLSNGQSWAVGRSDRCAVVLNSRSVSRVHALIQRIEAGGFCLIDLGSRNGSYVNGRRVSLPAKLADQDEVVFGEERLRFVNPFAAQGATHVPDDLRNAPTTALLSHKDVTIVVADIRDFTPLARMVSEAVLAQVIGTWFLRVGQAVQGLGSWGQKYIGDAVMAVWIHGKEGPQRADAVRALRAVSLISQVTTEVSRLLPLPAPLRIGAGVNSGPAIVGGADAAALGDAVNLAFRLETATKSLGLSVAIGERPFELLKLTADSPGPFERRGVLLKGYDGLHTAWATSFPALDAFLRAQPPE